MMNQGIAFPARLPWVWAALLLATACSDAAGPERGADAGMGLTPSTSAAADTVRISGTGTIGAAPEVPGSDVRDFDLDVASTLSGRVFYRDWLVVRPDGSVGTIRVSPTDTATRITAFRDSSTACSDPSTGVEFDGVGRVNTGGDSDPSGDELLNFTVWACDAGPAGSGADYLAMIVPGHDYARGDNLTSGDLVRSSSGAGTASDQPPVVNAGPDETALLGLLYALNASFSDPDNDGPWTYTIDWGDASSSSGAVSSQGTITATHSYLLPLSTRTVTVTVTDSHGTSGSDTKQVTVIL